VDDGTWVGYPSGRVTVVRYRCSAGGVGGVEVRSGSTSSGCGCAGSLQLFVALDVDAVSVEHCASGRVLGCRGPLCSRYHSRMLSVRRLAEQDVRFGVRCGVDLVSPEKRGLELSVGRP
jgi:hypothetical protein